MSISLVIVVICLSPAPMVYCLDAGAYAGDLQCSSLDFLFWVGGTGWMFGVHSEREKNTYTKIQLYVYVI